MLALLSILASVLAESLRAFTRVVANRYLKDEVSRKRADWIEKRQTELVLGAETVYTLTQVAIAGLLVMSGVAAWKGPEPAIAGAVCAVVFAVITLATRAVGAALGKARGPQIVMLCSWFMPLLVVLGRPWFWAEYLRAKTTPAEGAEDKLVQDIKEVVEAHEDEEIEEKPEETEPENALLLRGHLRCSPCRAAPPRQ